MGFVWNEQKNFMKYHLKMMCQGKLMLCPKMSKMLFAFIHSLKKKKISTNFISDASSEQTEIWCELCTVDSLSSSDGFQCFPWEKLFGFMNIKHECVCWFVCESILCTYFRELFYTPHFFVHHPKTQPHISFRTFLVGFRWHFGFVVDSLFLYHVNIEYSNTNCTTNAQILKERA